MATLVETLASYVPAMVLRRLRDGARPEPLCERRLAAVPFADNSGSTALAERGPAGAEDLSRINQYFGRLIETINAHGGDVVKFAGDGLLALWPIEGQADEASAVGRAAQCGLALQAADGEPRRGEVELTLRVGIACGQVLALTLGGEGGRWEFLAAGPAVRDSGSAQKEARPGEVIASPAAWRLVREQWVGDERTSGFARLRSVRTPLAPVRLEPVPVQSGVEPYLHGFAPRAIEARLIGGRTEWFAELRRVTTMFINLPGLDFAADFDAAQGIARRIQRTLDRYEGSLARLGIDDKGPTLWAAWVYRRSPTRMTRCGPCAPHWRSAATCARSARGATSASRLAVASAARSATLAGASPR